MVWKNAEDALGRHALCDEVDDAAGHRIGLAAARSGHDEHVIAGGRVDDFCLLGAVGKSWCVHDCLVSKTVLISPAHAGHAAFMRQYWR